MGWSFKEHRGPLYKSTILRASETFGRVWIFWGMGRGQQKGEWKWKNGEGGEKGEKRGHCFGSRF